MKRLSIILFAALLLLYGAVAGQTTERRDTAVFVVPKNEFMDSVSKSLDQFYQKDTAKKLILRVDFSKIDAPLKISEFTQYWHNKPLSQAKSGMCWCFSTTSMLESEIYRQSGRQIKLSELYTVYWEYVEKARGYVRARGESEIGEGSQANAVYRDWKKYGIVPAESYSGLLNGQPFHDHTKMFEEISSYLKSLKSSNMWSESQAEETVRAIMNHYIGEPPKEIIVEGKKMTPLEYYEKITKLNVDDYVSISSF